MASAHNVTHPLRDARGSTEVEIALMNADTAIAWAERARVIRESGVMPFVAGVVLMAAAAVLVTLVVRYVAGT